MTRRGYRKTRTVYRSKPRRRRSYLGRIRRRLSGKTFPISMAPSLVVPIGTMISGDSELMGIAAAAQKYLPSGDFSNFSKETVNSISHQTIGYMPYNNRWDFNPLMRNVGMIVAGLAVHKLANASGVNRYMKRIPLVGKYISI